MSQEPERKLAAIVSADIVGYSRMMAEDETAALTSLRSFRQDIFEPAVRAQRGEIIKRMGDGWLLEFSSALDAAKCAVEILTALHKAGPIQLRIGVHIGDIVHENEDIYGDGVNVASRLQEMAAPNAVLISGEVNKIISGSLNVPFSDQGERELKNIPGKTQIFAWSPAPKAGRPLVTGARPQGRPSGRPFVLVNEIKTAEEAGEAFELAQEIHDELVIALSRHTGIRVVESARPPASPDYVIGGRCRVSGEQARLNLTMSDGASGEKMWAERFSGSISEIDDFIDRVSRRVDGIVRVQVNAFSGASLAALPDEELSFPELLTKAAHLFYCFDLPSTQQAEATLDVALKLQPDHPMALAMRAQVHCHSFLFSTENRIETDRDQAMALVNRAIELDAKIDFAFRTRASLRLWLFHDTDGAKADARRALEINPIYHLGLQTLATAELLSGEIEVGLERALNLLGMIPNDPQLGYYLSLIALGELLRGNEGEAYENAREAHERRPSSQWIGTVYAAAAAHRKDVTGTEGFRKMISRLDIHANVPQNLPFTRKQDKNLLRERLAASGAPE